MHPSPPQTLNIDMQIHTILMLDCRHFLRRHYYSDTTQHHSPPTVPPLPHSIPYQTVDPSPPHLAHFSSRNLTGSFPPQKVAQYTPITMQFLSWAGAFFQMEVSLNGLFEDWMAPFQSTLNRPHALPFFSSAQEHPISRRYWMQMGMCSMKAPPMPIIY